MERSQNIAFIDMDIILKNSKIGISINEQISLGYNMRLTDFQAALLHNQLKRLSKILKRKEQIHKTSKESNFFFESPRN